MAVADSFDAMISNRAYRQGLSFDTTIAELKRNSGTQFDPAVINTLVDMIGTVGQDNFMDVFCSHVKG